MKKIYICTESETFNYKQEQGVQTVESVMDADEVICAGKVAGRMKQQLLTARMINIPIRFVDDVNAINA